MTAPLIERQTNAVILLNSALLEIQTLLIIPRKLGPNYPHRIVAS